MRWLGDTVVCVDSPVTLSGPKPDGCVDHVTAFGTTAIHFDPTRIDGETVAAWLSGRTSRETEACASRVIEVPIVYDGADLAVIDEHASLSPAEVVRRHAAAEYTVGAIGFQPGFPYLQGLPKELRMPRRSTPRTRVPAGSVGIGGSYSGIYPTESPGGWNLLGRTPLTLFDEHREEPSLLRVGDRVRFQPIDEAVFDRLADENLPTTPPPDEPPERVLFRIVSPGVQTTVQGLGRFGRQHLGVTPGGAMDFASLRQANLLVGNEPDAAAIEATLVGPVLECLAPATVAVSGAVPAAATQRLTPGKRLDLRRLTGGARAYVALPGGVHGVVGRELAEGDLIGSADNDAVERTNASLLSPVRLGRIGWRSGKPPVLRVIRGPQADRFDESAWQRLLNEPFRISTQSSRMGVRCERPALPCPDASDLPSQPVCTGVIQVPPDGQPIVLGADRQTIGGYPIIAVVVSADWPQLGQLRPGDTVRFTEISLPDAIRARQQLERQLAIAAFGIRSTQV
ncbi:MAG: 5-oxoprolinase subunit PxpB [Planctomycetota bacterium]